MQFFIDEILGYGELKEKLLSDPELCARGKAEAEKIIAAGRYLPVEDGLTQVAAVAFLADHTLALHRAMGVPHDITVATLKDVNVWIENYRFVNGELGLSNIEWLTNHALGYLFRLGRLQFALGKAHPVVPSGEYVIEVHIPQGEPLNIDACFESFAKAKEFFAKYYPDKRAEYFVCGSWLLSPDIPSIADESSNICRFMRLWTQLPHEGDKSYQAIQRVFGFGFDPENIASAPENTTLQRRLKAHLLAGGSVESSFGCIKI
ncbi:MAG: DUF5596 domain-containing protein [Clostridia bacterium]|nr:DUF5596 domain-containing protein [Clostridia bacterium]